MPVASIPAPGGNRAACNKDLASRIPWKANGPSVWRLRGRKIISEPWDKLTIPKLAWPPMGSQPGNVVSGDVIALLDCGPKGPPMFQSALSRAIDAAHPRQIDQLSRTLWQAHAAGHLGDDQAQALAERLHSLRNRGGVAQGALFPFAGTDTPARRQNAPTGFPRRLEQRSPDRQASIQRRRRLAASGPMPPAMAAAYTVGELAVLRVVGDEVVAHGACDRSLAELAARAGVCRKLAQLTLRLAARDGLVTIERRPRPGRKNLSNVVRIISAEWSAWLKRGARRMASFGKVQGEKIYPPRAPDLERGLAGQKPARPARPWNRPGGSSPVLTGVNRRLSAQYARGAE